MKPELCCLLNKEDVTKRFQPNGHKQTVIVSCKRGHYPKELEGQNRSLLQNRFKGRGTVECYYEYAVRYPNEKNTDSSLFPKVVVCLISNQHQGGACSIFLLSELQMTENQTLVEVAA